MGILEQLNLRQSGQVAKDFVKDGAHGIRKKRKMQKLVRQQKRRQRRQRGK